MKKLVCIGGGEIPRYKNGVLLPYETKEIDEKIVELSNKKNPKFLFISIASSHPEEYFHGIKDVYTNLGCIVSHLDIKKTYDEIKKEILSTDIIYIGGGNTKYLIEKLKSAGIDKLLIQAYNEGIVCSGLSAGSYCWFKYNYDLIEGMGVINAVNCVHYDEKDKIAKDKFKNVIKDKNLKGYAIDNCVALQFIDDNISIIKSNPNKNAYIITYKDNEFIKESLDNKIDIITFNLEELKNNLNGFSYYILGRSYDLEENGVAENFNEALRFYNMGMDLNYPLCEYSIGISLILGLGDVLEVNIEKGTELLINAYPKIIDLINNPKLSLKERLYAKFVIGAYHYYGLGNIKKDDKKAFNIIKECAYEGHIAAIYDLGANFYYNGIGTERDVNKSKYYLKMASEAGLPRAIKKYNEYGFSLIDK